MSLSRNLVKEIGGLEITYYINNNNSRIANVGNPTNPQDAATKQYVDNNIINSSYNPGIGIIFSSGNTISVSPSLTNVTALGNINTGTWSANTIQVPYGGTGMSSFTPQTLIAGNGSNPLVSINSLLFNNNIFTVSSPINVTCTTDSTGVGSGGSLNILGGCSISKSLNIGSTLNVNGSSQFTNVTVANITIVGTSSFTTIVSQYSSLQNISSNNVVATNLSSSNLVLAIASITSITSTNSSIANLYNTNFFSLNNTSSNLNSLNSTITNLSSQSITTAGLLSTNNTFSNTFVTNSSVANLRVTNGTISSLVNTSLNTNNLTSANITNTTSITTNSLLVKTNTSLVNVTASNLILTSGTLGNIQVNQNMNVSNNLTSNSFTTGTLSAQNTSISNITNNNLVTQNISSNNLFLTYLTTSNIYSTNISTSTLFVPNVSILGTVSSSNLSTGSIYSSFDVNTQQLVTSNLTTSNTLTTNLKTTNITTSQFVSTNISTNNIVNNNLAILGSVQSTNISTGNLQVSSLANTIQLTSVNISSSTLRISDLSIQSTVNAFSVSTGSLYTPLVSFKNSIGIFQTTTNLISSNITTASFLSSNIAILNSVQATNVSSGNLYVSSKTVTNSIQSSFNTSNNISNTNLTSANLQIDNNATINKQLIIGTNFTANPSSTSGNILSVLPLIFTDSNSPSNSTNPMWTTAYLAASTLAAQNSNITTNKVSTLHIGSKPQPGANQTFNAASALSIGFVSNQSNSPLTGQIMLERNDGNWYSSIYVEDPSNRMVFANASLSGGGGIGLYTYTDTPIIFSHISSATSVSSTPFASFTRSVSTFVSTQNSTNSSTGAVVVYGGLGVSKTLCSSCLALSNIYYNVPPNNSTVNVPDLYSIVILKPISSVSNVFITPPSSPINGQILKITTTQNITSATIANCSIPSFSSISPQNPIRLIFSSTDSLWYFI